MALSSQKQSDSHKVFQSTFTNAYYLILLQLFSRMITFVLNTVLLCYSLPFIIGLTSIRFELILSTVSFLGREGIRSALLRYPLSRPEAEASEQHRLLRNRQFVNMAWIPLPFGLFLSFVIGYFYYWHPPEELVSPVKAGDGLLLATYQYCILLYACAVLIEFLYEPIFVAAQITLYYKARVWFEGLGIFIRSMTLIAGIVWVRYQGPLFFKSHRSSHVLVANDLLLFALTQMLYSVLQLTFYYAFAYYQMRQRRGLSSLEERHGHSWPFEAMSELFPTVTMSGSEPLIEPLSASLAWTLTQFSFLKQFLNQGDLMILSSFTSLNDQGVYSVASNYGSMVARILLQPLEETSRLLFSRGAAQDTLLAADSSSTQEKAASSTQEKAISSTGVSKHQLLQYLFILLKFDVYLGSFFVAFGAPFTLPLLYVLLGSFWAFETNTPLALSGFCLYIPFIALNGMLESFVSSVSNTKQLRSSQLYMVFSTALYLSFALFSIPRWLSLGVILANMFNMALRIMYCLIFLTRYVSVYRATESKGETVDFTRIFPARIPCLCLALSLLVNGSLAARFYYGFGHGMAYIWASPSVTLMMYHIGLGLLLFCVCVASIWMQDAQFIHETKMLLAEKKRKVD